jgi:hypothetical protein
MNYVLQQCANYIILNFKFLQIDIMKTLKPCPKGMNNIFVKLLDSPRLVSTYKAK